MGIALVVVAALAFAAAAVAVGRFQGWPLLVPGSIMLIGVAAFAVSSSLSPLSDEGLRQASNWQAFNRHLHDVARDRTSSPEPERFADLLPYAAAFGAALGWAKRLRKNGVGAAPPWIQSLSPESDRGIGGVIATLGAASSAGGHVDAGTAGVGGAGAAGGGASGAH